jgi:hypothetical protein
MVDGELEAVLQSLAVTSKRIEFSHASPENEKSLISNAASMMDINGLLRRLISPGRLFVYDPGSPELFGLTVAISNDCATTEPETNERRQRARLILTGHSLHVIHDDYIDRHFPGLEPEAQLLL